MEWFFLIYNEHFYLYLKNTSYISGVDMCIGSK